MISWTPLTDRIAPFIVTMARMRMTVSSTHYERANMLIFIVSGPGHDCGTVAPAWVISTSYYFSEAQLTDAYKTRQCAEYAKVFGI